MKIVPMTILLVGLMASITSAFAETQIISYPKLGGHLIHARSNGLQVCQRFGYKEYVRKSIVPTSVSYRFRQGLCANILKLNKHGDEKLKRCNNYFITEITCTNDF